MKPSVGKVWVFSGTTHFAENLMVLFLLKSDDFSPPF